jgi:hypothetical protein
MNECDWADLELTKVIDGDLVKVMSWHDNMGLRKSDGPPTGIGL